MTLIVYLAVGFNIFFPFIRFIFVASGGFIRNFQEKYYLKMLKPLPPLPKCNFLSERFLVSGNSSESSWRWFRCLGAEHIELIYHLKESVKRRGSGFLIDRLQTWENRQRPLNHHVTVCLEHVQISGHYQFRWRPGLTLLNLTDQTGYHLFGVLWPWIRKILWCFQPCTFPVKLCWSFLVVLSL